MPALAELEQAWVAARDDAGFRAELDVLLRDFVGRPSPLYLAAAAQRGAGRRLYLKREDLNHTGAHKINNAIGQALLARRMGKRRIIAETGAGQHGVATATACALMDLECVVYMGVEDIRRQAPNVQRMELLGATVSPVDAGARTLKEASSEAIRDLDDQCRHDALHHRLGGRPGAVPRDRARPAARDRRRGARADPRARGRLPDRVIACVGGGSNAIGIFAALRGRRGRRARRRGGRRRGARAGPPRGAADRRPGAPACCTARCRRCCRTRWARSSRPTRSRPAWTIRAAGPSTRTCATSGAPATWPSATPRRWRRSGASRGWRGSSRAGDRARAALRAGPGRLRARHRLLLGPRRQGPGRGPRRRHDGRRRGDRGGLRRRRAARGADALHDGRLPRHGHVAAHRRGVRRRGADLVELGVPFSDPLADGPVIHAAGTAALRAGATTHEVLAVGRAVAERVPVVAMVYTNLVMARGFERFADDLAAHGLSGLIVPDLPLEESDGVAPRATPATWPWCRSWRRRRRTSAWRASAPAPAGSSTPSRLPARRASALRWPMPSGTS